MTTLLSVADGTVATPLNSPPQGQQQCQEHGEDVARQSIGGGGSVGKEGGKRPQHQDPGPPLGQHRASSAGARAKEAADRSTASPLRTQRSRPRPRQSPSSPPPAYLYPRTTTTGAGAGARAGSLRPSVSGILAGNFGDSPQHRHERAASVGDRYKGNHNKGAVQRPRQKQHQQKQHQQQQNDCRSTGNRVIRAGDQSVERFGEYVGSATHSSRQPRRGPNRARGQYPAVSDVLGEDGSAAAMSAAGVEMEDRGGGTGATSRRRSGREDASRVELGGRDGDEAGSEGGEGDQRQQNEQQGHGRVAQIAEGLLWVQKHPVLAAVIWMCGKVLDPGAEDNQEETSTVEGASNGGAAGAEGRNGDYEYEDSSDPVSGMTGDFEKGRIVPPGFWRRHSKGRLSWSDDYQGGCLAEYYEDERARMASEASSIDANASGQQQHHSQQQHQHQQGQEQTSPSAFKLTAAATSCRRCDVGSRQYSHDHGGQAQAPTSCTTSTSVGRAGCSGCKQCSGDVGGAARARGGAGRNTRAARGGVVRVIPSGQARGEETNEGDYEGNDHNDDGNDDGNDDDDDDDDDDDGEVFHSALQLAVGGDCSHGDDAEELDALAGFFGGCGARVAQDDKFNGATRNSMADGGHRECVGDPGNRERDPAVGADSPGDGRISTSCKQTGELTGVSGPNGAGTPSSGAGAGTWSPQWGWYVTMTPPQDQYPAQQNSFPGVKPPTPTATAESSDTPISLEGRPPRP